MADINVTPGFRARIRRAIAHVGGVKKLAAMIPSTQSKTGHIDSAYLGQIAGGYPKGKRINTKTRDKIIKVLKELEKQVKSNPTTRLLNVISDPVTTQSKRIQPVLAGEETNKLMNLLEKKVQLLDEMIELAKQNR